VSADQPADPDQPETSRSGPIIAVVGVIIAVVLIALWLNRDTDDPEPASTPEPTPGETMAPSEPPEATTAPPQEPTEAAPAEQEPTAQDVATFADANGPAEHTATGDIDGDGVDEVVVARVRDESTHIVVGRWDGTAYRAFFSDDGGSAQRVDGLDLQDYNGEAGAEIVTLESVGESGASLSIWGAVGDGIGRLVAEGGCWDGFHHYGISGATIEPGEIVATCDGSPLPPEAWTSDVYAWQDGAWTYVRTDEPEV
jgi:hypothetical protein